MVIVVTGAAGAGKTTIGRALAAALGRPFVEAPHHPDAILARALDRRETCVVECVALTRHVREALHAGRHGVRIIFLQVPELELVRRAASAPDRHAQLRSQLGLLEVPTAGEPFAIVVDGSGPVDAIVAGIRRELGL